MNAYQQLARAEVNVTMLQEEKQLLEVAEHRLLIEAAALRNEQNSQSLLHVNLELIKLNMEQGQCKTRLELQNLTASVQEQLAATETPSRISSMDLKAQITRLFSTAMPATAADELVGELRAQLAEARSEAATNHEQLECVRQQADMYHKEAEKWQSRANVARLQADQRCRLPTSSPLLMIPTSAVLRMRNAKRSRVDEDGDV